MWLRFAIIATRINRRSSNSPGHSPPLRRAFGTGCHTASAPA